jgi:hypothetical protein
MIAWSAPNECHGQVRGRRVPPAGLVSDPDKARQQANHARPVPQQAGNRGGAALVVLARSRVGHRPRLWGPGTRRGRPQRRVRTQEIRPPGYVGAIAAANWESRAGLTLNHSTTRFAGDSEPSEPSEPKNNKVPQDLSRAETLCKKGSEGSAEPASWSLAPGESATEGQLQRMRRLVEEGMSEELAREAVLGKGWVP